jgi:hypothetical protein
MGMCVCVIFNFVAVCELSLQHTQNSGSLTGLKCKMLPCSCMGMFCCLLFTLDSVYVCVWVYMCYPNWEGIFADWL